MRKLTSLIFVLAMVTLIGCQEDTPQQPASKPVSKPEPTQAQPAVTQTIETVEIFSEPIEPVVLELPSEALPYWREVAKENKPALVLFSIHPLLQPVDEALQDDVTKLMNSGSIEDFKLHGSLYRAEPLVLPTQTLSAAIDAKLFSEIIWVFPSTAPPAEMQLPLFQKQVTEAGFMTEEEGNNLNLSGGIYTGTVRGVPFRGVHPGVLPTIDKPMILHVDLGFFKGLYQGEVKTRIYDLLLNTALAMNETGWAPELITLSYSTMEGTFSLDVRFLITNFAEMLRDPTLLDGTMPESWALRSEALYSVNFFLEGKVQEYYEQAATKFPEDAAAQYDLYKHMFFEQRKIDEALVVLDKAVSVDHGYAAAYLELAQIADKDGNMAAALELLDSAAPVVPENPMVDLYRAQFMIRSGQGENALPLIKKLKAMPWSTHYYAETPKLLEEMAKAALEEPQKAEPESGTEQQQ